MPDTPKRSRFFLEFPEPLAKRLRAYSERTGFREGEVIRAAVSEYLDRKEALLREMNAPPKP